ncbi:unnamed protein product [Caenorhabditis auriculariae]|uniref:ADP-ribosylation factor-like protein 1 n=1 Tax=Caenorhabditis auriculariae TaxID=2777116 RepID=A0A8S1I078_9PELO|nr:unnamed protein product [Caenorhabditis auriculariae]
MEKLALFDDDDEPAEEAGGSSDHISINKNYASRYDNWRQLEEMQKIKRSEAPEWTKNDEESFLRTLGALKSKDASIYDEKRRFFADEQAAQNGESSKNGKKAEKKMTAVISMKAMVTISLHKNRVIMKSRKRSGKVFKKALHGDDSDGDEELLVRRQKSDKEKKSEEDDFYEWLKERGDEPGSMKPKELQRLKVAWNDENIDEDEKFLRDYILNKDYEPTENEENPTYEEIVELEEDEKDMDRQRNFEIKYNFRFENPDQDFLKSFPRTVSESLRKDDSKRKEKRKERNERKKEEKEEKKKELKHLKKMKRSQIEEKLARLSKAAGCDIPLSIDELQADFDPKEFDKKMQAIFNDEYYGKEEDFKEDDNEKPVFSDDDAVLDSDYEDFDDVDVTKLKKNPEDVAEESGEEEEDDEKPGNSAGRAIKAAENALHRDGKDNRRKRKRNALKDALRREKPLFDPREKTFEEYFNEYFALDYEDVIGDQVTKFKYRDVVPNDFGLTADEILEADERQLNAWASLRKVTAYRTQQEEAFDLTAYRKKSLDSARKKKLFNTDFGGKRSKKKTEEVDGEKEETVELEEKKKKKKKRRVKKKTNGEAVVGREEKPEEKVAEKEEKTAVEPEPKVAENGQKAKKKRKRPAKAGVKLDKRAKMEKTLSSNLGQGMTEARVKAYGLNPNRLSKGLRYNKKNLDFFPLLSMGGVMSYFRGLFGAREMRILILGLDGAGKTTILYRLQVGEIVTTIPTIGFNVEQVEYKNLKFQVWDLGGQTSIRPYWRCYYANTDAIIYVVDSADRDRVGISKQELVSMLQEDELQGAVLAVLANKQDIPGCLTETEVYKALGLEALRNRTIQIFKTSASKGEGLDAAMDWLANQLQQRK